ncbi:MAG: hypothetical protein HZA88_14330 [Verrucomicrobia bacterium]|nr:hypothetical protein [Verrucomicrobiota bacterium]
MKLALILIVVIYCSLPFVNGAERDSKYLDLILPEQVVIGMTRKELQPLRPGTNTIMPQMGLRNTNAVVLVEVNSDRPPFTAFQYSFVKDELRAVMKGVLHAGFRDNQMVRKLHDALVKELHKKTDESIIRWDDNMRDVSVKAELWEDTKNGLCVYFVDTKNDTTIIVFDPKCFGKKDFFVNKEDMPKMAPALESVRKMMEEFDKQNK